MMRGNCKLIMNAKRVDEYYVVIQAKKLIFNKPPKYLLKVCSSVAKLVVEKERPDLSLGTQLSYVLLISKYLHVIGTTYISNSSSFALPINIWCWKSGITKTS